MLVKELRFVIGVVLIFGCGLCEFDALLAEVGADVMDAFVCEDVADDAGAVAYETDACVFSLDVDGVDHCIDKLSLIVDGIL